MSPARRSAKRRGWPDHLYEPRPGYYVWRHPETKENFTLGAIPLAHAKHQAAHANAHIMANTPSLVDRLTGAGNTIADLLEKMPVATNKNTAKSRRSLDKLIKAKLGDTICSALTVAACSRVLDELIEEGKDRLAQAVRSRLIALCKKGMQKGWMESNPAEVTEEPDVKVRRGRLVLETFQAVYAKAPEVAEWLQHAMMLALVSGQDRSTVAAMERTHVSDGHLTTWRTKSRETNQPVEIPLKLRMDCVGVSLAELAAHKTGVISKYLVHHVSPWGNAPAGSRVHPDRISHAFTDARKLAGIPDVLPDGKGAPTFHEIRSLCKRLYTAQGGVDTKALLSHKTDQAAEIYADPRGVEPIRVKVG